MALCLLRNCYLTIQLTPLIPRGREPRIAQAEAAMALSAIIAFPWLSTITGAGQALADCYADSRLQPCDSGPQCSTSLRKSARQRPHPAAAAGETYEERELCT